MFAATWPHVFVMLIVVLRLRPGFRQLRTLYPLCLSLTPVMPWMLSLQPPPGARLPRLLLVCPVPLPSIRVPCCSMLVLLPLVLVCPSECSSVCSSFRSPCVRRPSALSPLFYIYIMLVRAQPRAGNSFAPHVLAHWIWKLTVD